MKGPYRRATSIAMNALVDRLVILQFRLLALCILLSSSCSTFNHSNSEGSIPLDYLPALSGDYFRFTSRIVGRSFHIYVSLPEGYTPQSGERYPVVYLLDGDSLFPILATNHLFLNYDEDLPRAIIVGIAYGSFDQAVNKRGFDFSAPALDSAPGQGGAPAFQNFLKLELIPQVERRYSTDPSRRILFGQSRGGYMVLYSAFTEPDLFWGRIASNPSFDPGRKLFFSPAKPASRDNLGLVVTSGSREAPVRRKSALEWFDFWKDRDDAPWTLKTKTIEGGTHAANSTDSYRAGMLWFFNHPATRYQDSP